MAREATVGSSAWSALGDMHFGLRHLLGGIVATQSRHAKGALVSTWRCAFGARESSKTSLWGAHRCGDPHLEGTRKAGSRWRKAASGAPSLGSACHGYWRGVKPPRVVGAPPGPVHAPPLGAPLDGVVWRALEKGPGIDIGDAIIPSIESIHLIQLGERGVDRQGGKDIVLGRSGATVSRVDFVQRVMAGDSLDARILPVQYNIALQAWREGKGVDQCARRGPALAPHSSGTQRSKNVRVVSQVPSASTTTTRGIPSELEVASSISAPRLWSGGASIGTEGDQLGGNGRPTRSTEPQHHRESLQAGPDGRALLSGEGASCGGEGGSREKTSRCSRRGAGVVLGVGAEWSRGHGVPGSHETHQWQAGERGFDREAGKEGERGEVLGPLLTEPLHASKTCRAEDEFRGRRALGCKLPLLVKPLQALFRAVDYVDMAVSLNELSGYRDGAKASPDAVQTDAQKQMSVALAAHVRSFGLNAAPVSPSRASLQEVLGSSASYAGQESPLVSFGMARVSLPPPGSQSVSVWAMMGPGHEGSQ
eukprot:487979-Amphidinium_carterae.2